MACPKIEVRGKRVIILSGFQDVVKAARPAMLGEADVKEVDELRQSARLHPDAVAFGYVAGRWVPAA